MNINLKNDDIFKYVFSYEYILRDFINSFLEYIGEKEKVYIENVIPQYYIMPEEKSIKEYYGDLVATLNNSDIVSLEMEQGKSWRKKKRNDWRSRK